jgi:hypothetical protein
LVLLQTSGFGQSPACTSYPSGVESSAGTYTFRIDNLNTITTISVNNGSYVILNVVKGFTYTFAVGDIFTSGLRNENLTIFDASNNAYLYGNSGSGGCTISNWVSSLSGQVKILLTRGRCLTTSATGGTLALTLTGVNNTLDNQLLASIDSWIGHVYNNSGGSGSTTGAYNAAMFSPSGLMGFYKTLFLALNHLIYNSCFK